MTSSEPNTPGKVLENTTHRLQANSSSLCSPGLAWESSKPMMSSKPMIDRLPDELILEILECLYELADFRNIVLTSHRLYRLGIGFLYDCLIFPDCNAESFLYTVACKPHLGGHVKQVYWGRSRGNTPSSGVLTCGFRTVVDRQTIARKLRETESEFAATIAKAIPSLRNKADCIFLYAMLLFTPNLEELVVSDTSSWNNTMYWFDPVRFEPDLFQHLASANIRGPMRLQNVMPLFIIPSMRSVTLSEVFDLRRAEGSKHEWEYRRPDMSVETLLQVHGSNVEKLRIYESIFDAKELVPVFAAMSGLKSLVYEELLSTMGKDLLHDVSLYIAQSPQGPHLEYLRVGGIGSLKPLNDQNSLPFLTNLKHLEIAFVFGTELGPGEFAAFSRHLPRSIQRLTFKTYFDDLSSYQEQWSAALKEGAPWMTKQRLPMLEKLTFGAWSQEQSSPEQGWFPANYNEIKNMFEEIGVTFVSIIGNLHHI